MNSFYGIFFFLTITYAVSNREACNTPINRPGLCIDVDNCLPIQSILDNVRRTRNDTIYLRDSACGYNVDVRKLKVCCESATSESTTNCTTPNAEAGICISLLDCPTLLRFSNAGNRLAQENRTLLTKSACSGNHPFSVCCSDNTIQRTVASDMSTLLPSRQNCGREASVHKANEVKDGESAIDQFPWLAAIEYKDDDRDKSFYLCSATLITLRYVLAPAQCFHRKNIRNKVPKNVVLGVYDLTAEIHCSANGICTESTSLKISIEEILLHPNFNADIERNDIALVRMDRDVEFTDFIRPLCLPQMNIFENAPNIPVNLIISGWHLYFDDIERRSNGTKKLNLRVPAVEKSECQVFYDEHNFQLMEEHICAGGIVGRSSGNGDSGIPLMRFRNDQYEFIGFLSYGAKRSGSSIPDLYTNVFVYIDWIRNNIRK
ncbi:phenoloxidase-activating enzyme-like isoform X2 [Arctopsyche grandis]|uniref:phenoloxidase-activating enzyme-like isoform X2 n=1 Tax=Arctopsyche grandis TaxID=121162 RepID=UPI00406D6508